MHKKLTALIFIAAFGALYSGMLFYRNWTGEVCLGNVSCPQLFGLPVCLYGFLAFVVIFAVGLSVFHLQNLKKMLVNTMYWLSLGSVFFSVYFLVYELFLFPPQNAVWSLGYPGCLIGFICYLFIFFLSRWIVVDMTQHNET